MLGQEREGDKRGKASSVLVGREEGRFKTKDGGNCLER